MGTEAGVKHQRQRSGLCFYRQLYQFRIEDLRMVASFVKGKHKAGDVEVWIVPGSKAGGVAGKREGIDRVFEEAGLCCVSRDVHTCLGYE